VIALALLLLAAATVALAMWRRPVARTKVARNADEIFWRQLASHMNSASGRDDP